MATRTRTSIDTAGWTWSAVASGVIASLIVQVVLTMIGFGIGLVSFDAASKAAAPAWAGFAWWALSGIFAAAVGGWIAGTLSPTNNLRLKAIGGVTAWAIATLIVVGVGGLTAGAGVTTAGGLAGPVMVASRNYQAAQVPTIGRRETVGQSASVSVDEARKQLATLMLLSAVALILGAFAAYYGGMYSEERRTVQRSG